MLDPGRILAAHDAYPAGQGAERVHQTFWPQIHPLQPMKLPDRVAGTAAAVHVTVNHGRWVIVCPDCGEGQMAAKDDHRFYCIMCFNVGVDGAWRRVIWPRDADKIEAELMTRPDPLTRGWRPGESLEDLRKEAVDQQRPSVPHFEDLSKADQKALQAVFNDLKVPNPVVRWDDAERTKPVVEWKTAHRKFRKR